jgi:hypothetical protein
MECKFVNPNPLVKETDPRVSQRYRSESPDPDPKRHGSAKLWDLKKNWSLQVQRRKGDYTNLRKRCGKWEEKNTRLGGYFAWSIPDPGSELSPSRIPDPHRRI